MPEVLDPPAPPIKPARPLLPHAFTSANAAQMARRKHELWKLRKDEPAQAPHPASNGAEIAPSCHARALERLQAHIDRIDDLLDAVTAPADWRDLTNARDRLFNEWAHLAGIPKPGSRRPGRESKARPAPVLLEPTAAGDQAGGS